MLLELARLFSHLYTSSKSHARYNMIFLLSGAGKLNYQGSKRWLDDQLDGLEGSIIQVCIFGYIFFIAFFFSNVELCFWLVLRSSLNVC